MNKPNPDLPKLTREQRDILIGKLLGDAHLEAVTPKQTYRLVIEQSKKFSSYVDYLYEIFKPMVSTPPKEVKHNYITKSGEQKTSLNKSFKTRVHPGFRFYGQLFYPEHTKRIPKNIRKLLTPRVLAYWYMDDGSRKGKNRTGKILNTQGFCFDDVELLSKALADYGIDNTVQNKNVSYTKYLKRDSIPEGFVKEEKHYKVIYITATGDPVFTQMIEPYVLDCFKYKL